MNITIKKYEGGGSALPFVDYMPFTGVATDVTSSDEISGSSAKSKSSSSDSKEPGMKDLLSLIKEMKGKALPSDIDRITKSAMAMYATSNLYGSGKLSTSDVVTKYLSTLQKISIADFNYDQFKKAQDTAKENGGLNEVAIDSNGMLIVQDKQSGSIHRLTVDQFNQLQQESPDQFEALTNNNLLYYRAHDNNFAFKNDILLTISNGIGEAKVTEMLQNALKNVGTTTLKQEGYSEKAAGRIKGGIALMEQVFEQGMTVDGLYKQGMLSKDQKEQITAAMNYLWKVMPQNAKTWLKYKSGAEDSEKGAQALMQTLMFAQNSPTKEFSLDLVKDPNSSDSADKLQSSFLGSIQAGTNGREATIHYNLGGKYSNTGMSITGTAYGIAMDPSGKPIDQTSMFNMLQQSRILGIAEGTNNIYFGTQKMSLENLRNIAYTGDEMLRVNIPVNSDGSPNFTLLKKYTEAQQKFQMSGKTQEDMKRIFGSDPELASLYKPDGTLNMSRFRPYLLVNGITTDKLAGIDLEKNDYVHEMKPDPALYSQIKQSLVVGSGKNAKYPDIDEYGWSESIFKGWGEWINGYDHIVKGALYIPLNTNKAAAAMYANQHLTKSQNEAYEQDYQMQDEFLNYNEDGNSADLLNN